MLESNKQEVAVGAAEGESATAAAGRVIEGLLADGWDGCRHCLPDAHGKGVGHPDAK
jgi:hypothetical protein